MTNIAARINTVAKQLVAATKVLGIWRIKVDGEFVVLRSGKTLWKQENHAKSALRNHFHPVVWKCTYEIAYDEEMDLDWREAETLVEAEYQKFLKERVEFVTVM